MFSESNYNLPEEAERLTCAGRYTTADKLVGEIMSDLTKGSIIRILDIGAGVEANGSITDQEFSVLLTQHNLNPNIISFDPFGKKTGKDEVVENINYVQDPQDINGMFDVIRILRVIEHANNYEYLRDFAELNLREGGIMMVTELLALPTNDFLEDYRKYGYVVKIMQKREGKLITLALVNEDKFLPIDSTNATSFNDTMIQDVSSDPRLSLFWERIKVLQIQGFNLDISSLDRTEMMKDSTTSSTNQEDQYASEELLKARLNEAAEYFSKNYKADLNLEPTLSRYLLNPIPGEYYWVAPEKNISDGLRRIIRKIFGSSR